MPSLLGLSPSSWDLHRGVSDHRERGLLHDHARRTRQNAEASRRRGRRNPIHDTPVRLKKPRAPCAHHSIQLGRLESGTYQAGAREFRIRSPPLEPSFWLRAPPVARIPRTHLEANLTLCLAFIAWKSTRRCLKAKRTEALIQLSTAIHRSDVYNSGYRKEDTLFRIPPRRTTRHATPPARRPGREPEKELGTLRWRPHDIQRAFKSYGVLDCARQGVLSLSPQLGTLSPDWFSSKKIDRTEPNRGLPLMNSPEHLR